MREALEQLYLPTLLVQGSLPMLMRRLALQHVPYLGSLQPLLLVLGLQLVPQRSTLLMLRLIFALSSAVDFVELRLASHLVATGVLVG